LQSTPLNTLNGILKDLKAQSKVKVEAHSPAILMVAQNRKQLVDMACRRAAALLQEPSQERIAQGHHPDCHFIQPEGNMEFHSIDTARWIMEKAYLPPFAADARVFIIERADRLLPIAASALLKTLEGPPQWCHFFLLTQYPGFLLPTLRSRLQLFILQEKIETLKEEFVSLLLPLCIPSHCFPHAAFEQLEYQIEEIKIPIERHHLMQQLLDTFLALHMDIRLVLWKADRSLMHYPTWRDQIQERIVPLSLTDFPTLEQIWDRVERCQKGLQHHVSVRSCLYYLIDDSPFIQRRKSNGEVNRV